MTELKIQKIYPDAKLPQKATPSSAGYDIFSYEEVTILAKDKGMVHTGIKASIPEGSYGRVAPRSGLAWKNFIDIGAGVIDSDYRGESKS